MKFVALLTIVNSDLNQEHRPAHLDYINRLFKQGQVVEAGPFTDGSGGMVVYECDTPEQAQHMAEADPVVAHGARTVVVRPWNPLQFPLD